MCTLAHTQRCKERKTQEEDASERRNKCATSVQQVWYLLRGVIELAAFAKRTVLTKN